MPCVVLSESIDGSDSARSTMGAATGNALISRGQRVFVSRNASSAIEEARCEPYCCDSEGLPSYLLLLLLSSSGESLGMLL